MAEIKQKPEEEIAKEQKPKKQRNILGEIAGGVCLASTMVSCLSLFLIAMVNLG